MITRKSFTRFLAGPRRVALGYAVLAMFMMLLIWSQADQWIENRLFADARAQVTAEVSSYGVSLTQTLNRRLNLVSGLSAFTSIAGAEGAIPDKDFEAFSESLYRSTEGLRNIALAPQGVVAYVYPVEENKTVLGYEPAADERPNVRAEVQRAIMTREVVMSLPYELIQGGIGVIARQAVFVDGNYWGLANIVIDVPPLLSEAGLSPEGNGLQVAIKDQSGQVFFGLEDVFDEMPVSATIILPEGNWELAGIPQNGWRSTYEKQLWLTRVLIGFLVIFFVWATYLLTDRQARLEQNVAEKTQDLSNTLQELQASEDRYRAILHSQVDIILRFSPDGRITFVNEAYCQFFGKSKEYFLGMNYLENAPPEVRQILRRQIAKLSLETPIARNENKNIDAHGKVHWFSWSNQAVFNDAGEVIEYQSVGRDITERVRAEEALKESEEKFRTVADFAYNWEYWISPEKNFLYVSPSCENITGYRADEFIQDDELFTEIVHPEDLDAVLDHHRVVLDGGDKGHLSFRIITRSGEERWIGHTCHPVYSQDGRFLGQRGSNRDITDQIRADNALREEKERTQTYLDIAGVIILALDRDGKITMINQKGCEILGYSEGELLGKNWFKIAVPAAMQPEVEAVFKQLVSGESELVEYYENPILTKSGEEKLIAWHNNLIRSPEGNIINIISSGEDITRQSQMQRLQATLYRISQAANRSGAPEDLYPAIHEIIREVMPADNFYIALHNPAADRLHMVYIDDEIDPTPVAVTRNGSTEYVYKTGKTLLCTAAQLEALQQSGEIILGGPSAALWLGVPLIAEGRTIGVMAVQHYHDAEAYGEADVHMLEVISTSVANTIIGQLAQAETQIYAQINALLYQAGQQLSESLDLKTLYRNLYNLIAEWMDCDTFIVSAYDPEEGMIHCDFIIHDDKEEDAGSLPPIPLEPEGKGNQSLVIRSGESILIDDLVARTQNANTAYFIDEKGEIGDYADIPKDAQKTQSLIAVPLKLSGQVIGVVQVMSYQRGVYSQDHLSFLEALSAQISLSTNNARLFQQAQEEIELRAQAERQLKELNAALEERIDQRTRELEQRVETVEALNLGMANLMSDLRAASEAAARNARELKAANTELESFAYSVSHDLRAPLRHIDSFARLLLKRVEDDLDETSRRYFENILVSSKRMRQLIEDLLALSRTGQTDLRFKELDFNEMIADIRAEISDSLEGRDIEWTLATLPSVKADPGLMSIVWTNLIGNAVKYTRTREQAKIEIGALLPDENASQASIIFYVRDNGVGFNPEYKDKLFGVFQRLHQEDEFEGTGIGLASVRRIIQRHHGKVWAEGEVDGGATFYFSLPVKQ